MRSCTRAPAHRPRLRTSPFLWRSAIKANVVGSPRSLNYRGKGSSSRQRGLHPASADPDRNLFTTLTIRDGELPPADDPGPSADDFPGHPHADDLRAIRKQTTSGPSASRRPPGHPQADDLRASVDGPFDVYGRSSLSSVDDLTGGTPPPLPPLPPPIGHP